MARYSKVLIPLLGIFLFTGRAASSFGAVETFTNPVISDGADPWITYREGYYYLTYTTGSNVQIHRATRLTGTNGIGQAGVIAAFYPPAPFNQDIWAPELHFLRGKTYLYYAADDGNNADHRMFAAESDTTGPTFTFVAKGKVYDPTTDRWAIDGTVLEATNGSLYFIWSGWPGTQDGLQNLYIAPMTDPLTISGPRVLLATPDQPWESWIEEGPEVLQRDGVVFVVYAANLSPPSQPPMARSMARAIAVSPNRSTGPKTGFFITRRSTAGPGGTATSECNLSPGRPTATRASVSRCRQD